MKKLFLLLFTASLAFVSCSDDDSRVLGAKDTIVGFSSGATTKPYLTDVTDAELVLPVTLISYANEHFPSNDITASWEIIAPTDYLNPDDFEDPADYTAELATFATEGTEFDAPSGGGGEVTIPSGETVANLPAIAVHPTTLDPNFPKKVVVRLTSANDAVVGYQYREIVVTLQGVCPSDLAGSYVIENNPAWPAVTTALGNGVYNCSRLPYLSSGGNAIPFEFSDVCDVITINCLVLGDSFLVEGEGVVNGDGTYTITYILYNGTSNTDPVYFDFSDQPATYY